MRPCLLENDDGFLRHAWAPDSRDLLLGRGLGCLRAVAGRFYLFEGGPYMHGNGPTRDFHGLDRSIPLDERDHQNAKYVEEGMLLFGLLAHVGANGADQAVAQQN